MTSTGDRMGAARLRATHARTSAPRTQGWDKTYCLQFVKPDFDEIHFFGDKTFQGGNDYEIFVSADTLGHTVTGPGVCVGGGGGMSGGDSVCTRARARKLSLASPCPPQTTLSASCTSWTWCE